MRSYLYGGLIAALFVMLFVTSGCNSSRRDPVATIEPTYSYLRAPVAQTGTSAASVAQLPQSVTTPTSVVNVPVE